MADVPGPSGVTTTKKEGKDIKPENVVDFYSEDFDPLITLYSNQVILPKPNAKPFDNLAMWNSHYSRGGAKETAKKVINQPLPQRRWLPHQLPIPSKKQTRKEKNVFTRMDAAQGPLSLLRKYVQEKTPIKIITRNDKGVRGYCTGVLIAFDKHFNLALKEVVEVWKRSGNNKFTVSIENTKIEEEVSSQKRHISPPVIETKKISKKVVECRRTVSQMIMRGEHVVLIHAVSGDT